MSYREIARELYRAKQEVERLEKLLAVARPEDEAALREALREARANRAQLARIIDGAKGR